MKMWLRVMAIAVLAAMTMALAACGGGGSSGSGGSTGGSASSGPVTLEIGSKGEELAFDKTELTVAAGQTVTLRFKNNSAVQQHNWVLIKGGDAEAAAVANAGLSAGPAANYLPADKSNILAESPLANGGETVEVTFTAPAAGTYLFICTVPGHYPLMQGKLVVN
ncbi:plastocyanin/azurin family copper-binding protein [Chloroflexus aggregans]|uniref:Blue (Type 1) copper domain protein n=1 Tax=Chloroflexus aggregans (strain MD-66 / DSM 9485) TaxID=326427 RepID=B8G2W9_CHLAD|nr:plastocyanin/azurin family copper-binding protein [Chloroflexus aggregans]ACL23273.1 blue (type 1) copper domain protein [Chloroflexus aggregans DSM 9485]